MFDLTVLPIKPPKKRNTLKRPVDERLPDIDAGAMVLLVACIKSGKSTLISNLLLSPHFYKESFDNVYIISPSIHNDVTSRHLLHEFENTVFERYDDSIIKNIIKYQSTFTPEKRPRFALICDDIMGEIGKNDAINNFATRFRHFGCKLLLFSVQAFKGLPPVIRANCTDAFIGCPMPNLGELDKIADEYSALYEGKENFLRLYHEACNERYKFMYLRLHHRPTECWRSFDERIYVGTDFQGLSKAD
tara:strand:+ start:1036 stop:1776 length:741 start_codon:yes stop_codon:yes gene_type:complete